MVPICKIQRKGIIKDLMKNNSLVRRNNLILRKYMHLIFQENLV